MKQKYQLEDAFTLLELIVVIAIIAILSVFLVPNIMSGYKKSQINATRAEIGKLKGMVEQYQSRWGDYPATSIIGFTDVDNTNQGVETLVASLSNNANGGPFLEWDEKRYSNYDNDFTSQKTNWLFGDNQLREIIDVWRYPFIYFHCRDYENYQRYSNYLVSIDSENKTFIAEPQRSSAIKVFHNPNSYQIWSIGPDGENGNGSGDDISNW